MAFVICTARYCAHPGPVIGAMTRLPVQWCDEAKRQHKLAMQREQQAAGWA